MNVQRLIEKYEKLEGVWDAEGAESARKIFLMDLKQLDEPQPVKVPQFVADWIEVCKEHLTTSLYTAMNPDFMKENNQSFDFILWIKKTSNQETFARAWLDGYEVEEEKRYYVRFKWIEEAYSYLTFIKRFDAWTLADIKLDKKFRSEHTRKQLEDAEFGWVFDCPGIEVEEVE
ncbi:DUF1642 domain-containing protein [Streptococcus mitis]|uniref:DUF1642 domain-containing protein n=1 Tax=Streptococcus mitis TaxID=28037 RepID=UPI0021BAD8F5|nr:DUF1642 domain-containing protein [Streptococcus mitis]